MGSASSSSHQSLLTEVQWSKGAKRREPMVFYYLLSLEMQAQSQAGISQNMSHYPVPALPPQGSPSPRLNSRLSSLLFSPLLGACSNVESSPHLLTCSKPAQVSVPISFPGSSWPGPWPCQRSGTSPGAAPLGHVAPWESSIYLCDSLINVSLPSKIELAWYLSTISPSLSDARHVVGTQ